MNKDNEIALTVILMILPILICIGVGYCFNLTLSGKYDTIIYVIIGDIQFARKKAKGKQENENGE